MYINKIGLIFFIISEHYQNMTLTFFCTKPYEYAFSVGILTYSIAVPYSITFKLDKQVLTKNKLKNVSCLNE